MGIIIQVFANMQFKWLFTKLKKVHRQLIEFEWENQINGDSIFYSTYSSTSAALVPKNEEIIAKSLALLLNL